LPDDHEVNVNVDIVLNEFNAGVGDRNIKVNFVWGVKGVDK
jgi:hypothetical protein